MATPQVGWYYAECCLLDLQRIDDQAELESLLESIDDEPESGKMIFPTLAAAVAQFRGELSPEDEARELARLGWKDDQ